MGSVDLPVTGPGAGITRRELLNYAWLASVGVLAINIAGVGVYFSIPRPGEDEFGGIIKLGSLADLPAINAAPVNHPEGRFWLIRTDKGVAALYKVCPHLDCLFNWNEAESKFICPCHGSRFDRDGARLSGPSPRSLDRFVVQFVSPSGEILAETDIHTGALLPLAELANAAPAITVALLPDNLPPDTLVQVDTARKISGQLLPEQTA